MPYPKLYIHQMYTLGSMYSGRLVFHWKVFWFWIIHAQTNHCKKCRKWCFRGPNNSKFSGEACPRSPLSFSTVVPQSDFTLDPPLILDVLLLSLITFSDWLMNQWRETVCLCILNWSIYATQVFPALGLINFDFSLITFVGTLPTSCRYIGLKISPNPPHFQIPGYVTDIKR